MGLVVNAIFYSFHIDLLLLLHSCCYEIRQENKGRSVHYLNNMVVLPQLMSHSVSA